MGGALSGNTVSLDPHVSGSRGQAKGREKSFLCVRCFPACCGQVAALAGDRGGLPKGRRGSLPGTEGVHRWERSLRPSHALFPVGVFLGRNQENEHSISFLPLIPSFS